MFAQYPDTQQGHDTGMGTPGIFHNPSLEKQMAALNAANIAKMANRSAPGSAQSPVLAQSSSGYFGGNSLLHQSNGNMTGLNLAIPSPSDQHLQSSSLSDFSGHPSQQSGGNPALAAFQQNMNVQPPNNMSITTPTSAGPQNAFPDPNHRSTPAPNQQMAQMQQMQKRKQFIQTLGSLMLQRGQPLPQALTGIPIPAGIDPNASPWKNLEPSQTEVGAIRLAGKDFDLYKFFGIVFQTGGGMKVCISSPHFLHATPFPPGSTIISPLLRGFSAHMTFWANSICLPTNSLFPFLGSSNGCLAQCLATV
jgi:SWI/SNF chromatin-remodeling complex subunit SWI1